MYLRAIEIQGFKSFPDRVRLQFDRGMTAVVGPNGSGKSNISDAVRWVLGEQSTKTLRGAKMEDVIFSGTKLRKPTGFAQVSLHIDNTDRVLPVENDLCTVTRKLYRSGESDYLINGESVRLRDVRELFMDTGLGRDGYSVIGQGKIAEIVSAKESERREIFEEAAGIAKFRFRKEEALRRLAGAQDNLSRLKDILGELEGRVEPLREQAGKAKRFLSLSEEKRALEISLWLTRFSAYASRLREMGNQILLRGGEYEGMERELGALEQQLEQLAGEAAACTAKAQEKGARRLELEGELGELTSQAAISATNAARNRQALAELEESLRQQGEAAQKLGEEETALLAALEECAAREKAAEAQVLAGQSALAQLRQQEEALNQAAARQEALHRQAMQSLSDEKLGAVTAQSSLSELAVRLEALEKEQEARALSLEDTERGLESARALVKAAGERAEEYANVCAGYEKRLEGLEGRRQALERTLEEARFALREREQKAGILRDMEKSLEGFSPSVKTVMRFAREGAVPGVVGPVSSLISVQEEYAVAIETALGFSIQNIVVEEEQGAKEAIRLLKERSGGRATFLPLSTIRPRGLRETGLAGNEGYVGVASQLVATEERYRVVAEFLLGNIVVAEDMNSASRMARRYGYRLRIVTLDGQVINPGGSFTGGSRFQSGGFITRSNQIERLEREMEQLKAAAQAKEPQRRALAQELAALEEQRRQVEAQRALALRDQTEARVQAGGLESALAEQQAGRKALAQQREELLARRQSLQEMTGRSDSRIGAAEQALEEARQGGEALQQEQQAHRERQQQADTTLQQLRLGLLAAQKDRESGEERLAALRERQALSGQDRERQQQAVAQLAQDTLRLEEELRRCEEQQREKQEQQKQLEQEAHALGARRLELEAEATRLRQEERVKAGLKEQASRALAALEEKRASEQAGYDGLVAKLWDEYELTRSEAERLADPLPDTPENQNRLLGLRQSIRQLGTVNLEAIDEYEQVNARYQFLKAQTRDAATAKEELEKLIDGLTHSMVTLFSQGFAQIGKYFTEIFRELFGGGSASLRLTDEGNVLESGVEILVEPPGKIIKSLSLLSGGEQALVAIALYFAILRYRPSPFCVLDEIEAALDDVNVAKYAAYVKRAGKKTQFIVITHRRGTMESADVLYGVTMQEEGVSKLLQIDVAQAEQEILTASSD